MENLPIKSGAISFADLFASGCFSVPWHQRRYDWSKDNVEEMLSDIKESFDKKEWYFLGTISLVEKNNRQWEILDGQQRMVTFSLICARLCRLFAERGRSHGASEALCMRMIFDIRWTENKKLVDANNLRARLTPPEYDSSQYRVMIRGEEIGRNGPLTVAWNAIDSFISLSFKGKLKDASSFLNFLAHKVLVSRLILKNEVNQNSIFEFINSRGKPLSDFDLTRNYIYSFFQSSDEEEKRKSVHINLEAMYTHLKPQASKKYAECFFRCEYGHLPTKKFYKAVKRKITKQKADDERIYALVCNLTKKVHREIYRAISDTGSTLTNEVLKGFHVACGSPRTRDIGEILKELRTYTVTHPIIFAFLRLVMDEEDSAEQKKMAKFAFRQIKLLNSFVMRTSFVSPRFAPSLYEEKFYEFAKDIRKKNIYGMDIFSMLKKADDNEILDESVFIEKLKSMQFKPQDTGAASKKAALFLSGLALYQKASAIKHDISGFSVEHVLPQSDKHWPYWDGFTQESCKGFVNRIGNLALLPAGARVQGDAFNRSFEAKKEEYAKAPIEETKMISSFVSWSPEAINRRQEKLAKKAVKVWSFSDDGLRK